MYKGIEWLKKEIEEVLYSAHLRGEHTAMHSNVMYDDIVNKIDQLDEPEVLSQELIYEKAIDTHVDTINGDIQVTFILEDLQNVIVPKKELPEIPKFVADTLEENTFADLPTAFEELFSANAGHYYGEDVCKWIVSNEEAFARAWLDGFTVAEEQKYIISINITDKASKTNYETFLNKRGIFHSVDNESFNSEDFNWTEEEIKDMENGEILFEHFAVKVEELE